MAINERLVHTASAAAAAGGGTGNQEEGLILHLDANDVDSYDGDGDVWYDIKDHEYTPSTNVSEHFNTVIWTGDASTRSIAGVGFEPDLVWIKNITSTSGYNHGIFDSIRGANKVISSNTTDSENQYGNWTQQLTSFDSDGFSLGDNSDSGNYVNLSGDDYVAWCFKAGGAPSVSNPFMIDGTAYPTASEASLDDAAGVLTSASINTNLGFGIYNIEYASNEYTTAFKHGLGQKPELVITKQTDGTSPWYVIANNNGSNDRLQLNTNGGFSSDQYFDVDNTTISTAYTTAAYDMIAYAFTSKRGVSKVGSYAGGAAGNKIYTGFEPAFVIVKNAGSGSWEMFDNTRGITKKLWANENLQEATNASPSYIEFNRDGFEFPITSGGANSSGNNYIYYAAAKNTNETSLIPPKDEFTAGSIETTDLELNLDANSYSGSGDWLDGTSNSNNGTIAGAAYVNDGNSDYFSFDGTNDSVNLGGSVRKALPMSVEMWINPSSTTRGVVYSNYDTSTIKGFYIRLESSLKFQIDAYNGSAGNRTLLDQTGSALPLNRWSHCVFTFDTSQVKIYLNGELDTQVGTNASGIGFTPGFDTLLARRAGGDLFTGLIGQTRVYSSTLTQAQIQLNYKATRSYDWPELQLHLDAASFDGSTNTPTTWTALTGSNGTITGATFDAELGNYLNITSDSTYIDVPTANMLDSDFTIEMWYNLSSTSSSYKMLLGGSNYQNQTGLGHYVYGDTIKTWISVSGATTNVMTSPSVITANKWQHIVLKRQGSTWTQYIDGEQVHTVTGSTASLSSPNSRIGRHYNATALFASGKSGQVRVYSSALTQEQIRQNYNFTKSSYPNGNDVTVSSSQFLPSSVSFDFNSTSNVTVNSSSIPANVYTICCWFNADVLSTAGLVSWGDAGTNYERRSLIIWNGGSGGFKLYSSTYASNIGGSTTLTTGTWYHGAITMDNGSCKIYLNGTEDGSGTNTLADYISPTLYVGRTAEASEKFDGKISDVKVFNKVLTPTEIVAQAAIGYNGIG